MLLLACLVGCTEEPMLANTELMLVADTDIADLERIEFEISGQGDQRSAGGPVRADGAPLTLTVLRANGSLGPVTVRARGFTGDVLRIERHAVVSFVPQKTVVVALHLVASCIEATCAATETCTERACQSATLDSDELPIWIGSAPTLAGNTGVDAAAGADSAAPGVDAGSGTDAAVELDAGDQQPDAGELDAQLPYDASLVSDGQLPSDATIIANDAGPDAAQWAECGEAGPVDLNSNVNHCGKCNKACSGPLYSWLNIKWVCRSGACDYGCTALYGNCDGLGTNGCERSLAYNSSSCGSCTTQCSSSELCNAQGSCVPQSM